MLIQEDALEKQYRTFRKALPEVTPYYAIKANPFPGIIKKFIELGTGFDVASAIITISIRDIRDWLIA